MQSIAWSLMMLLVVLAMIPAAMWVLKRIQTIRPAGQARQLELIAQLPLGARERVVMVRAQGRVFVLGATTQQVSLLAEVDAAAALADAPAPMQAPQGFAQLMDNLRNLQAPRGKK
ncbi:MAG: flagellar biosynthetic protein FliO [Burkholderiaceae bacterium]